MWNFLKYLTILAVTLLQFSAFSVDATPKSPSTRCTECSGFHGGVTGNGLGPSCDKKNSRSAPSGGKMVREVAIAARAALQRVLSLDANASVPMSGTSWKKNSLPR